jgi:NADH-quinone oxidoreductase subunit F
MSTHETIQSGDSGQAAAGGCWETMRWPAPELLDGLKSGPFAEARAAGEEQYHALVSSLRRETPVKPTIFIGAGTCGLGAGAAKTLAAIREHLDAHHIDADVVEVGCIGLCSEEPIVDVQFPGRTRVSFGTVTKDNAGGLLEHVFAGQIPADMVLGQFRPLDGQQPWADVPFMDEHSFLSMQRRVVLINSGLIDPGSIDEYIALGGYSALAKALKAHTPEQVCDLVEGSGLRGRGGGGFPTGRKWKFARQAPGTEKYLICNADEGDPGAFMDRAVGESDPHRLLEGMALAAYAIGASHAYIYIRAEYPLAIKRLKQAIAQAQAYGLLGEHILRSGFSLEIKIKMGAGAFVCGEETALIHSIEGRRGMPRPRPPFPAASGLFAKSTVINNVETLANLPQIVEHGAEWYAAMGTPGSKGTKVFALSGMVQRTGLVEIPMGTTLRQVVFEIGGGVPGGRKCKAVQIGGPSGGCVPEPQLDVATDYEALKNFGTIMGSGGLVVVDETTCMVDFAKFFMEFIQSESCGKCIPCREGTRRMLEILQAITRPRRKEDDTDALLRFQGIMYLKELGEMIKKTSLCGLGQTAPNPVLSTLKWFRDEYEAHIYDRRCPAGACKELVGAPCQNTCPAGTEVWRYVAHIARGEYKEAYKVIREALPFPSVCARVCHHPCEYMCRAGVTGGEPIAVRTLKRFVVDRVSANTFAPDVKPAAPDAPKIAVIGAGPSGLTAAYYLGTMGYPVTVFEREDQAGGMLAGAIPEYRLSRSQLRYEIDRMLVSNVELRYNQVLGRDFSLDDLLGPQGFKAVYVATGAHHSRKIGVNGEDGCENVFTGIQFLKSYNLHGREIAKGRVGVIGGGNSAIDAARVALRQKRVEKVTVFYRRTQAEMPAYREEIDAAWEENIELRTLEAPVEVLSKDGKLAGLKVVKCKLGEPDASGRRQSIPVPGSEQIFELDTLIVAISEQPEKEGLDGLEFSRGGTLQINPESMATSRPGVFAGGDVVTGPNSAVDAIAAGKNAARMIANYVSGRLLRTLPKVKLPSVYIEPAAIEEEEGETANRVEPPLLTVAKRRKNFAEVELCISEEQARCEAKRCLRCDLEFTQPA